MSTKSGDIDKDKSGWTLKHPEHLKKTWQTKVFPSLDQ